MFGKPGKPARSLAAALSTIPASAIRRSSRVLTTPLQIDRPASVPSVADSIIYTGQTAAAASGTSTQEKLVDTTDQVVKDDALAAVTGGKFDRSVNVGTKAQLTTEPEMKQVIVLPGQGPAAIHPSRKSERASSNDAFASGSQRIGLSREAGEGSVRSDTGPSTETSKPEEKKKEKGGAIAADGTVFVTSMEDSDGNYVPIFGTTVRHNLQTVKVPPKTRTVIPGQHGRPPEGPATGSIKPGTGTLGEGLIVYDFLISLLEEKAKPSRSGRSVRGEESENAGQVLPVDARRIFQSRLNTLFDLENQNKPVDWKVQGPMPNNVGAIGSAIHSIERVPTTSTNVHGKRAALDQAYDNVQDNLDSTAFSGRAVLTPVNVGHEMRSTMSHFKGKYYDQNFMPHLKTPGERAQAIIQDHARLMAKKQKQAASKAASPAVKP